MSKETDRLLLLIRARAEDFRRDTGLEPNTVALPTAEFRQLTEQGYDEMMLIEDDSNSRVITVGSMQSREYNLPSRGQEISEIV